MVWMDGVYLLLEFGVRGNFSYGKVSGSRNEAVDVAIITALWIVDFSSFLYFRFLAGIMIQTGVE